MTFGNFQKIGNCKFVCSEPGRTKKEGLYLWILHPTECVYWQQQLIFIYFQQKKYRWKSY